MNITDFINNNSNALLVAGAVGVGLYVLPAAVAAVSSVALKVFLAVAALKLVTQWNNYNSPDLVRNVLRLAVDSAEAIVVHCRGLANLVR